MDVTTGTVTSSTLIWQHKASVYFDVSSSDFCPLYGEKLDNGAEKVLYRWVFSTPQIEQMQVTFEPMGSSSFFYSTNNLPGRTVQKGKVYHTFLNWDGTDLKITNRAGTAY